ncbi:VCBS repeat-containing protein [Tunicatimonas pelagia]|uniref:VCBS repeat-containing protein n=1 Tax=Tunicatimonas pelagia TaxID=931531 RepID=UPI002666FCAA|nr:VCBS repeat-containing protein [Tunicatimonas pelagia]WKN42809.1 VCBS repeat-containing protein [Tunicatimonas pelagia]
MTYKILIGIICSCVFLTNCQSRQSAVFQLLPPEQTGIHFTNAIAENDSLNVIDYAYLYNGGGVGVGDINNDGLDDLFFAGNQVSSQLYLNRGELQFDDITEVSGTTTSRWATGVAMVDINQDNWLDIYVCVASKFDSTLSRNYFFINQGVNDEGIPTFIDQAAKFNLNDAGYSTQAAFFDYDLDGDLDMYLLTNGMETFNHNLARKKNTNGGGISTDKLYRNDSSGKSIAFTEVSREAGILIEGYGLGVGINDFNQDGYPDIYVANDFITNDLMWINNGDGTFTDRAGEYLKHHSHNGMGTDVADFNNDGLVDIMVLDMLPEDNYRQKTMLGKPSYDRFQINLGYGYTPQYVRNTLQMHNGFTPSGHPSFSEIGQLAGVHATDWSWSALFADYDNDGYRDLLITNGYVKDVTNLDFITYLSASSQFGTAEAKHNKSLALTEMLKEAKVHNYVYRNNGGDSSSTLLFSDVSEAWGMREPSFTNGTAFADLDQDGDLDLVMNNINENAFIYENHIPQDGKHNFLRVSLTGPSNNPYGFQAVIQLHSGSQTQYHYHVPYRGYKSTVEANVHFGLGSTSVVDSLVILWPDNRVQRLYNVTINQQLSVSYQDASPRKPSEKISPPPPLLIEVTDSMSLEWKHQEAAFNDFNYQPLLHRSFSREGPGLAVGDVNGDGLEDFFVGGATNQSGAFFLQQANGEFLQQDLAQHTQSEDLDAILFDPDQDGNLDLYVVSGGNEFNENHPAYLDRLYRNDGTGSFTYDSTALPTFFTSGSCVAASDYDQDGDLDLFVGGRLIPQQYPLAASSYILENRNGKFVDVTAEVAPVLQQFGLVTSVLWTDFNQDQQPDLLLSGEWMPLTFLENQHGTFSNVTDNTGLLNTSGWWSSLAQGDFDNDGDTDYLAGNIGWNTKYKFSEEEPIRLYISDYDQNGSIDPILSYYIQGKEYAAHSRGQLIDQLVGMRKRFSDYNSYALTSFNEVFTTKELAEAEILESVMMTSCYLENLGNNKFQSRELPVRAQIAPINAMSVADVNQDGNLDVVAVGNSYAPETQHGWFDASIGWVFLGDGQGDFHSVSLSESGFFVDTDAKAIVPFTQNTNETSWIIASNNDSLQVYRLNNLAQQPSINLP